MVLWGGAHSALSHRAACARGARGRAACRSFAAIICALPPRVPRAPPVRRPPRASVGQALAAVAHGRTLASHLAHSSRSAPSPPAETGVFEWCAVPRREIFFHFVFCPRRSGCPSWTMSTIVSWLTAVAVAPMLARWDQTLADRGEPLDVPLVARACIPRAVH